MQGAAVATRGDFGVGLLCPRERMIGGLRNDRPELRIERVDALQVNAGEPIRGDLLRLDPAREIGDRCKRDVRVIRGQRRNGATAPHEDVAGGSRRAIDQRRRPHRRGRHALFDGHLARAGPAFEHRGERSLPARRRQIAIRRSHRDLYELLGLCERGRGDRRSCHRAGAERRRRTRGGRRSRCRCRRRTGRGLRVTGRGSGQSTEWH